MSSSEVYPSANGVKPFAFVAEKFLSLSFSIYLLGIATSMSLMEIGSALLLVCFLARPQKQIQWGSVPLLKPILIFMGIALVGIVLGQSTLREKIYDLGRLRFFIYYGVLFFFLSNDLKEFNWVKFLRVVTSLIAVYGFAQHFVAIDLIRPEGKKVLMYALQDEKIGPLVVGTFNHHLTFSNSYLFFACLFLSLGLLNPKKNRYDLFLGSILSLLVFWTQSRVAWVALPICFTVLALFHYGKKAFFVSVVAIGILVGGVFYLSPSFQQRLTKTFETTDHRSYLPRLTLWRAQIDMWKESPWVGVGWNNNERLSKQYVDRLTPTPSGNFYGHAHSMPLQILATTGILGLLAFLWLWGELFVRNLKTIRLTTDVPRAIAIGLLASFVGFWIQGLTQWNFGDAEVVYLVIFFWAVATSLKGRCNSVSHSS